MSDDIPFEIQTEIIKRAADVKSLIRFISVSKPWKSFIDSSEFIAGYRARETQPHTLLFRYNDDYNEVKYLSVHSDTFTQQQDLAPNISDLMKQQNDTIVIGYSRGLLCLYAKNDRMLVLWNPSLRRSVGIRGAEYSGVFGFAVCPVTNQPTIVKISFPWNVQIFTLSSKKWTEIQCRKPRESFAFHEGSHVVIGICIYRLAYEIIYLPDNDFRVEHMIVSIDLIAKEFKAIDLDEIINLLTTPGRVLLSKLKGSLVVIVLYQSEAKVWKMEPDCSFTQLFTISKLGSYINNIARFRKNGEVVIETRNTAGWNTGLEVYDPCSHHINNLGFSGQVGSFFIGSYKETLHLLDHSDSCVYSEIN